MTKIFLVHSAGQTRKQALYGLNTPRPGDQWIFHGPRDGGLCIRKCFSTTSSYALDHTHEKYRRHDRYADNKFNHLAKRAKEKMWDKEFFFDLLSSAATKRDAKAYLTRLRSPSKVNPPDPDPAKSAQRLSIDGLGHGVNLGSFFDGPIEQGETTHVALVKIATPQLLDNGTIAGIAQTLSQLARLSMVPCVVMDLRPEDSETFQSGRAAAVHQVNRLVEAIEAIRGATARPMENILSLNQEGFCKVFSRRLLLRPLREGRIPVIAPIAYEETTQQAVIVPADTAVLTLARELAGLTLHRLYHDGPKELAAKYQALQRQISVDRVIVLDPSGAISSPGPPSKTHVFINMEQEYEDISADLTHVDGKSDSKNSIATPSMTTERGSISLSSNMVDPSVFHFQNLRLLQSVLALLPPTSSAIVTTPDEAAKSSQISRQIEQVSIVGTRRQKNPLIHNLLTDKPAQSSSLPPGRMGRISSASTPDITSTFVKRGMPLTLIPDPRTTPWRPDGLRVNLQDPRIDLGRLVYLVEDSFNRPLDINDYLARVNDRIAGLIIAGNYEGGALFTWETPPGCSETATDRLVPYLDKFAVLKQSQGAGGVADIVFNAMVRGCLPDGVCWRSRRDNPVNKWYFERARGTWKLPGENWTMFWTTEGVFDRNGRDDENARLVFDDYYSVCRSVKPSWADRKHIVD